MTPEETSVSLPTPILDSGVLPPRARRITLGGVVIGVASGVIFGFILIKAVGGQADKTLDPNVGLLLLVSAFALAVTIHEFGHLVAGWAVGFRFSLIHIGPFSLRLEHGKLRPRFRREMFALGYAGMHADRVHRLRRRLLIYVAAGPAANILSLPATALLVNHVFPRLAETWVGALAAQFVVSLCCPQC